MFPKRLDYTKNECRAKLRNIELGAYEVVMNALRAQGHLSDDKARILRDLRAVFHITDDRHKAEARRVANDEKLSTIADLIVGYETCRDWAREGRREVPLLPRGIAETAFCKVADVLSGRMADKNKKMPLPEKTERDRSVTEAIPFYEERKPEPTLMPPKLVQPTSYPHIPAEDSGICRKRRAIDDNIMLNQQLYPNVTKAQMAGRRGFKRPRKEKKQKLPPPPIFPKVDYEESINQLQDQPLPPPNHQGFNRIIHSYASNPINAEIMAPRLQPPPPNPTSHVEAQPPVNHTKEPKVQILSNEPVKIIPALALKTLQAKGNVKLVQSPPGKVVLRPLNEPDSSKVHQIKAVPATVAGAKLNVQLMQGATKSNIIIVNKSEAAASLPSPKSVVQIVNTNGEATKPTIVRNISNASSATIGRPNFIKLDPSQLKTFRILSVPTSTSGGGDRILYAHKSPLTPIKLPKDSKLYPINYNNGSSAPMVIESKSVPVRLPQAQMATNNVEQLQTNQGTKTKLIPKANHMPVNTETTNPHVLSYDDIIEEDSGDDTDKTKSQDEQSDVEVSCEMDGSTAFFRKKSSESTLQPEDKLSELARTLLDE